MVSSLSDLPWYVLLCVSILAALTLIFIALFVIPAFRLGSRLERVLAGISSAQGAHDLSTVFEPYSGLRHLWTEFHETLHPQKAVNPVTGITEVVGLRATVPSEMFFTESTIANTPLRAEFFKHLPGVFTGVGIIGTFMGLMAGLQAFKLTEDPSDARTSLTSLLHSVQEAFTVSAIAIGLAMVVTLFEKTLLVHIHRKVQRLTQAIDEKYKAGMGEEYLARLVGATEESASQSRILKDALVGDLKTILIEISEKQIAALSSSHTQLAQRISDSLTGQLKQPLEQLASATANVRQDQSSAIHQLMADLLARFGDRMENLLGSQVTGMQQMQQRALDALGTAINELQRMSDTVAGAGQRASDTLIGKLEDTLHRLDQRQLVMTEEVRKFVHEIRALVGQSQSETHQELKKLIADLSSHSGALITDLSQRSQATVGEMGIHMEKLSGNLAEAALQMASAIARLESVTTDAIGRMNIGAENLAMAADDFARAGQGVASTLDRAEGLAGQLTHSTSSLSAASHAVESVLSDYRATRDAVAQMLSAVQSTVEAARREASLTADVLAKLDGAATRLAAAQRAADEYLEQVNAVLADSHRSFAGAMNETLKSGNHTFHESVSTAVKMLRETIQDLDGVLGSVIPKRA